MESDGELEKEMPQCPERTKERKLGGGGREWGGGENEYVLIQPAFFCFLKFDPMSFTSFLCKPLIITQETKQMRQLHVVVCVCAIKLVFTVCTDSPVVSLRGVPESKAGG